MAFSETTYNWYQVDRDPKNSMAENLDGLIIAPKLSNNIVQ